MTKPTDTTHHIGHFRARLLWALQPIVDYNRKCDPMRFIDGNVFLEPAPMGGVFLGAAHGHAMAVFHDPNGYASGPMTLDIPGGAFAACKDPDPIHITYWGECYDLPLPEWAQPEKCYVYSTGIHVQPRMRHPDWSEEPDHFQPALYSIASSNGTKVHRVGFDFRLTEGIDIPWRKPLEKAAQAEPRRSDQPLAFNPAIANLFTRIREMYAFDRDCVSPPLIWHHATHISEEKWSPIIVTIEGHQEFVGTYMPTIQGDPQPMWDAFLIRAHQAPEATQ